MITEKIILALFSIFAFLLNGIPDSVSFPTTALNSLNNVFNIIFDNLSFLGVFIRLDTIKVLLPLVLIVVNLEYIIKLIVWLLGKIPGLNIH